MVDQPAGCHIGEPKTQVAKGGSLPCINPPPIDPVDTPTSSVSAPNADIRPTEEPEFTDFPDTMDWWTDMVPTIQNNNPLQIGWTFFPPNEYPDRKRKRTGDDESFLSTPAGLQLQPKPSKELSAPPSVEGINFSNRLDSSAGRRPETQTSHDRLIAEHAQSAPSKQAPQVPLLLSHPPQIQEAPHERNATPIEVAGQPGAPKTTPVLPSVQLNLPSLKAAHNKAPDKVTLPRQYPINHFVAPKVTPPNTNTQATIRVPVSSVPDQSVSPRTKSVQIPAPTIQGSYKSPYSTTPGSTTQAGITVAGNTLHSNLSNVQSLTEAQSVLPTPSRTNPGDILRKPSLYKIPAWQPTVAQPSLQLQLPSTSNWADRPNANPGGNTPISTARPVPVSQTSNQTPHTNFPQTSRKPRKHAPNL